MWRKTTILQIPKSTTGTTNLDEMRNIHLKDPIPKFFGNILMNEVKEDLMNSMTKYQLGTKSGHRAQEHIFVLKSVISLFAMNKEGIIANLYDISKFFDKELIPDVLGEAYSGGLKDRS